MSYFTRSRRVQGGDGGESPKHFFFSSTPINEKIKRLAWLSSHTPKQKYCYEQAHAK
jgi:hypothetical protein